MNRIRLLFLAFFGFLALVVYAADIGLGSHYWGWLRQFPIGDKVCHFGTHVHLLRSYESGAEMPGRRAVQQRAILLGTVIVAIVVAGEEFSQIWIPGRTFDLFDLTADFLGIVAGNLLSQRSLSRSHRTGRTQQGLHGMSELSTMVRSAG